MYMFVPRLPYLSVFGFNFEFHVPVILLSSNHDSFPAIPASYPFPLFTFRWKVHFISLLSRLSRFSRPSRLYLVE